jgi:predicted nuclease of predicted toxin-antitoxin system
VKIWLDAQLSPELARWISTTYALEAVSVRELGFRDAQDEMIFLAAREAGAIVMTKDHDFVVLLDRLGPPPRVLWITCGNTSNARMRSILENVLEQALRLLQSEPLVEIGAPRGDAE